MVQANGHLTQASIMRGGRVARQRNVWGSVRKLPSGRFQARYTVNGRLHAAPMTFETKRDADTFLARVRTELSKGRWVDPTASAVSLRVYADRWMEQHPGLRPRTRELYESELRLHILPALGDVAIGDLTVASVRAWRSAMLRAGSPGPSTVAKCYRLLRAILNTAVEDELIARNPCVIKGAGVERAPERPVVTIAQVYELADAIEPRFRVMVLLAAFGGFRLGELQALTRQRVNLLHNEIEVVEQLHELKGGLLTGPPKSDAGIRRVAIPAALKPELEQHLAEHAAPGKDGLLFCGRQGQPIRRSNFNAAWQRARETVGLPHLHFHDLRHTGNTLAAATGASTKELMARMGHASPRAALIYQHAIRERDHAIAQALDDMINATTRATRQDRRGA